MSTLRRWVGEATADRYSTTVSSSTVILRELKRMRENLDQFEEQVRTGNLIEVSEEN